MNTRDTTDNPRGYQRLVAATMLSGLCLRMPYDLFCFTTASTRPINLRPRALEYVRPFTTPPYALLPRHCLTTFHPRVSCPPLSSPFKNWRFLGATFWKPGSDILVAIYVYLCQDLWPHFVCLFCLTGNTGLPREVLVGKLSLLQSAEMLDHAPY